MTQNETDSRKAMSAIPKVSRSAPYFHPMRDADFSSDSNDIAGASKIVHHDSASTSTSSNPEVRIFVKKSSKRHVAVSTSTVNESVEDPIKGTKQRKVVRIEVDPSTSKEINVKVKLTKRNTKSNSRQIQNEEPKSTVKPIVFAAPYNPGDENMPTSLEAHERNVSLIRKRWELFADANIMDIVTNGYPIKVKRIR